LQELSTPAKGEKAENVDDVEEDADVLLFRMAGSRFGLIIGLSIY
jgi:hypothetical protein